MQVSDACRYRGSPFDRRGFLAGTAATAALAVTEAACARQAEDEPLAFFLVADTHYLARKDSPEELDQRSRRVTSGLVRTLNELPGTAIPQAALQGTVRMPRGVLHAGDVIDSGDKNGQLWERMAATEWQAYESDFGVDGREGRLKYPTFEVHGNHDGPRGAGVAIDGMIARNKRRKGLTGVSANGLHCSWDWGAVHFVNLGIVVGQVPEVAERRRYDPLGSLDFLVEDLRAHVGDSGRPVVVMHHIDVARYTLPCAADDPANGYREWHPCDVRGFHRAIAPYHVIAILHGHTHTRSVQEWDGKSARAAVGIPVFNVDNSSHFHSDKQAFFYFEIGPRELLVRECATSDAWQTYHWTPQVWRRRIGGV